MVRGKHHGLPQRPLVALRIAHQDEHPARRSLQPGGESGSCADRQPLAKRSCREVDPGKRTLGVYAEQAPVTAIGIESFGGELAPEEERGVKGERGVPLREDEAITLRVSWIRNPEHSVVERRDHVGD